VAEGGGGSGHVVVLEDVAVLVKEVEENPVGPPEADHNVILATASTQTNLLAKEKNYSKTPLNNPVFTDPDKTTFVPVKRLGN